MRDDAALPLTLRLHTVVSRMSRDGGYVTEQGYVAEAAGRILELEGCLRALLDYVDHVSRSEGAVGRIGDSVPAVNAAQRALGSA